VFDGHGDFTRDGESGGNAVIVLLEQGDALRMRRVHPWDRLTARLRAAALDRALAAGASPESSVALAVHAQHLHNGAQRSLLARSLRRVGAFSEVSSARHRHAPLDHGAVRRARAELDALAARLASSEPLDVRGVARVRTLLADGTGPLYCEHEPGRLRRELVATLASLDLPRAN
jgi:hypothetical protein